MASVENTASPPCCADRSLRRTVEHGRQRSWPLASRPEQSPLHRASQCPLQIARPPVLDRSALAQLLETAVYGPVRTVVWEGRSREAPPVPIVADRRAPSAANSQTAAKCGGRRRSGPPWWPAPRGLRYIAQAAKRSVRSISAPSTAIRLRQSEASC